jgi:hypothetical protein
MCELPMPIDQCHKKREHYEQVLLTLEMMMIRGSKNLESAVTINHFICVLIDR